MTIYFNHDIIQNNKFSIESIRYGVLSVNLKYQMLFIIFIY